MSIQVSGLCSKDPRFKDFLIRVDSLKADIETTYSETFVSSLVEIDIYGIISYYGCSRFSPCNTYVKDNDLIIEAWKTRDTEAIATTSMGIAASLGYPVGN
jgi:hypothetical protein